MALTMKNVVFWDLTPCGSCSMLRLLVIANVIPSSPILVILMMEAKCSSYTSVLTGASRHHIPKDGVHHGHRYGNLKSCIELIGWTL
jgi:hypothetical protein